MPGLSERAVTLLELAILIFLLIFLLLDSESPIDHWEERGGVLILEVSR
jgi:hypothetical protein